MERDVLTAEGGVDNYVISTHTLTWSVTWWQGSGTADNVISTHTLTWSVT